MTGSEASGRHIARRRSSSESPSHDKYRDGRRRGAGHEHEAPRSTRSRSPRKDRYTRRDLDRRDSERRERRERRDHSELSDRERRRRHRHPSSEDIDHRPRYQDRDRQAGSRHDRPPRRRRETSRSRSPSSRARSARSKSPRALQRSKGPLPSQADAFTTEITGTASAPPVAKEKPNFGNTGRLAAESNTVTVQGGAVVLKYHEPPEARKAPAKEPWRLYVFKGDELLEVVELGERSCWLIGRERLVVDFPLDHPSCSKQHAAIQFRYVEKRNESGDRIGKVKPYLIDLESSNGSSVNGDAVPPGRYVELRDKDVLRFGLSSREYVLMLPPPN